MTNPLHFTFSDIDIPAETIPPSACSYPGSEYLPFVSWLVRRTFMGLPKSAVLTVTTPADFVWLLGEILGDDRLDGGIRIRPFPDPDIDSVWSIRIETALPPDGQLLSAHIALRDEILGEAPNTCFRLDVHACLSSDTPSGWVGTPIARLLDPGQRQFRADIRRQAGLAAEIIRLRRALISTTRLADQNRRILLEQREAGRSLDALTQAWLEADRVRKAAENNRTAALAEHDAAQEQTASASRGLRHRLARRLSPASFPLAPSPAPLSPEPLRSQTARCILFIAGEPDTPGVAYRCDRLAIAARVAGYEARVTPCAAIGPHDIAWADIMVLWRVEFSGHVDTLLRLGQEKGTVTIFDADDIVFVPHLARIDIIDGIRSIGATEERIERCFADMRRTMLRCDLGFATTKELAHVMRIDKRLTLLVPNVYDQATLARARMAHRMRPTREDGLVRIGYATGSRTHQRDFAPVVPVLRDVLLARPHARLVLFREAGNKRPVLLMEEFPELSDVQDQIEWRDMVPLTDLPDEFARFDISIAPLETGNVFCEAKSEIKYVEPALAGTVCVASPTGPFRRVIRDGITGVLADSAKAWKQALLVLIDDPAKRARMARDAYNDVLWPFGPQAQAQRLRTVFDGLGTGDPSDAARSAETLIARQMRPRAPLPTIPESTALHTQDCLREAEVTVVVTSYNYASYILDALDSVRDQTLECLDLIVVDDGSTDDSTDLVQRWMERNASRFNRLALLRTNTNAGLGGARNVGMDAAETPFVMQLDADNRLLPEACAELRDSMADDQTAYAYPIMRIFNATGVVMVAATPDDPQGHSRPALLGDVPFEPLAMTGGNHVDATAMIAKWAWAAVGGYYVARDAMGWEDYDLWCRCAELGLTGRYVPKILAEYRAHDASMTNGVTERARHKARIVDFVERRHPWIDLVAADARQRQ
ncbi:glycosyltransferase [Brytella acorum]|uniref:Glycosyltransferase n=1 Tax=Brytella acorum TaxID=2959299 RepID=A0AA35UL67_9PROT|nr:glycosyltransferase [Brytella acorum]MDF3625602.1 glycosyltransferase [Brytella acorum]CAI9119467.1 glycosyltransferase [Brytella acorum]